MDQSVSAVGRQSRRGTGGHPGFMSGAVAAHPQINLCVNAAFDKRAADCQERVFRLAFRITRNYADAEDAQQETLLKAHRNVHQFEGRSRFTTWQANITRNVFTETNAESIDRAREMWWLGVRDIEREHYNAHGGNFWEGRERPTPRIRGRPTSRSSWQVIRRMPVRLGQTLPGHLEQRGISPGIRARVQVLPGAPKAKG